MGLLRLFLALSVVIQHSAPLYSYTALYGVTAVEMFFIISGFYMGLVLSTKYTKAQSATPVSNFYKSRFLRLYPTFVLCSLGTLAWLGLAWVYLGRPPETAILPLYGLIDSQSTIGLLILSNLLMIGQDIPNLFHVNQASGSLMLTMTDGNPLPDGSPWLGFARIIGPAWSIGTEIWFYLMAPWLVRRSLKCLFTILTASLLIKVYVVLCLHRLDYFFFPAQLCFFIGGILAYKLGSKAPILQLRFVQYGAFTFLVSLAVLSGAMHIPYSRLLLYISTVLLIYPIYRLSAAWATDRFIGELSYPVYMAHSLIIMAIDNTFHLSRNPHYAAIVAVTTLAASAVIYWVVERPVDQFRARYSP